MAPILEGQFLTPWAACVAADQLLGLRRLRRQPGVQILEADGAVWIRGDLLDEQGERLLRMLAPSRRFEVTAGEQLIPHGSRVPAGKLPQGRWVDVADWMPLSLAQPAGLPASIPALVQIRCIRCDHLRPASVLLTRFDSWFEYGTAASRCRLGRWSFAVDADGRALVRGEPVPPIPGTMFVEEHGVAVQAGWRWDPPVSASVVRQVMGLAARDLALLHCNGEWERIEEDQFVRATRSALRNTREMMAPT